MLQRIRRGTALVPWLVNNFSSFSGSLSMAVYLQIPFLMWWVEEQELLTDVFGRATFLGKYWVAFWRSKLYFTSQVRRVVKKGAKKFEGRTNRRTDRTNPLQNPFPKEPVETLTCVGGWNARMMSLLLSSTEFIIRNNWRSWRSVVIWKVFQFLCRKMSNSIINN